MIRIPNSFCDTGNDYVWGVGSSRYTFSAGSLSVAFSFYIDTTMSYFWGFIPVVSVSSVEWSDPAPRHMWWGVGLYSLSPVHGCQLMFKLEDYTDSGLETSWMLNNLVSEPLSNDTWHDAMVTFTNDESPRCWVDGVETTPAVHTATGPTHIDIGEHEAYYNLGAMETLSTGISYWREVYTWSVNLENKADDLNNLIAGGHIGGAVGSYNEYLIHYHPFAIEKIVRGTSRYTGRIDGGHYPVQFWDAYTFWGGDSDGAGSRGITCDIITP